MAEGYNFRSGSGLDVPDKHGHVVGPLRPRIDVTPLARAVAVTSQVHRVGAHTVLGHAVGEPLVAAGVLTEAVHHGECDVGVLLWPSAVGQLCAVGGDDFARDCGRELSCQGGPNLCGSCAV